MTTDRWSAVSSMMLSRWAGPVQESSRESWQRQSALCAAAPLPRWPETGQERQGTCFPLGQKCSVDSSLITAHLVIRSFFPEKMCTRVQIHTHAFTLQNIVGYSAAASKTMSSSSPVRECKTECTAVAAKGRGRAGVLGHQSYSKTWGRGPCRLG